MILVDRLCSSSLRRCAGTVWIVIAMLGCRKPVSAVPAQPPSIEQQIHSVSDAAAVDVVPAQPVAALVLQRSSWVDLAPGVAGLRGFRTRVRFSDSTEAQWIAVRVELASIAWTALATTAERIERTDPGNMLVLFDAGFFNADHRPSGVLEADHNVFGQGMPNGGSGLFVVDQGRAQLLSSSVEQRVWAGKELAVQCGPRLIEAGGVPGIYSDRGDRYARTALCLRNGGTVVDVIETWVEGDALHGPGLFAFSQALAAPSPMGDPQGCESALNLDGGPSTGIFVRNQPQFSHPAMGPVPYAIGLRPRATTTAVASR